MAEIKLNFKQYDEIIKKSCLSRMHEAAKLLRDDMKKNCHRNYNIKRPPYKTGPYAGRTWTSRVWPTDMSIMAETIRVVEKKGLGLHQSPDVRVYAGNWKTWWATQMEFGRGGWKGGAHPFMRPSVQKLQSQIKVVLESGNAETSDSEDYNNGR